jgi:hypothetical protein
VLIPTLPRSGKLRDLRVVGVFLFALSLFDCDPVWAEPVQVAQAAPQAEKESPATPAPAAPAAVPAKQPKAAAPKAAPHPAPTAAAAGIFAPEAPNLSPAQNPEPVLHAARAGFGPCLSAVERGSASIIDAPHNAFSSWNQGAPNQHAFLSIAIEAYPAAAAPRATSIILATPSATGCDASTVQVFPTVRSCAEVEKDLLKSGAVIGKLAGLPVYSSNTGGNRVLMPSAGNGCVIIGTNVLYVPAAPPPPPSIVQPGSTAPAAQPSK